MREFRALIEQGDLELGIHRGALEAQRKRDQEQSQ